MFETVFGAINQRRRSIVNDINTVYTTRCAVKVDRTPRPKANRTRALQQDIPVYPRGNVAFDLRTFLWKPKNKRFIRIFENNSYKNYNVFDNRRAHGLYRISRRRQCDGPNSKRTRTRGFVRVWTQRIVIIIQDLSRFSQSVRYTGTHRYWFTSCIRLISAQLTRTVRIKRSWKGGANDVFRKTWSSPKVVNLHGRVGH